MRKDASLREEERLYLADLHRRLGEGSDPKVTDIMEVKVKVFQVEAAVRDAEQYLANRERFWTEWD